MDSYSGHGYYHLQISTSGKETVAARAAYELVADSHRVNIRSFHVDNGIYAEKAFTDDISNSGQTINFYGVGALYHNGAAEDHIERLTRGSQTNLLYAQRQWPDAIG